jgi:ubiquinone/menaquinone biosynthesis C-methylase UbiE
MSSNENKVKEKYKNLEEEKRATKSRYSEMEFHYTIKHISEYINSNTTVIELGCGTGYYAMYFADKCKEYIGVDITPENILLFNDKIKSKKIKNVKAKLGDATNLSEISDNCFDVVLCLGPLYHLPPNERELVFSECKRICKDEGTAVFAYINKIGAYAGACVHDKFREYYPNEKANDLILTKNTDDIESNLFFYTMPEEIELVAKKYGFSKIKNLGVDFFTMMSIVENMNDEKYEILKPLLDQMASYESCTGMSNHAILVCKK